MSWILSFILLLSWDASNGLEENKSDSGASWLTADMPRAMYHFTPTSIGNSSCTAQGAMYRAHLKNLTLWAVTMLDSTVLAPFGVLGSSMYTPGAYDECLAISVPIDNGGFVGQYCRIEMTFVPKGKRRLGESLIYVEPGPYEHVSKKLQRTKDPRIEPRDTIFWGLCVPSGCTDEDVLHSLNEQLVPVLYNSGWKVNLTVREKTCLTVLDQLPVQRSTIIYWSVVGTLLMIVVIVSAVHILLYNAVERKTLNHWILSFSAVNNIKMMLKPEGPPEYQFMSGVKVMSMFLIIFGHRYLTTFFGPIVNPDQVEQAYTDFTQVFPLNGFIIVNTFLLISGFFTHVKLLRDLEKKRTINVFIYTFYRWFRVTSVYLTVIFFSAYAMPYLGASFGPYWKLDGMNRHNACAANWWTHILYISNYYTVSQYECLIPTWYLSVDMQLFVIAVIYGYLVSKWQKLEIPILSLLTVISIVLPMVVVYIKNYGPVLRFFKPFIQHYFEREEYIETYTRTHMRAAPYFIGMFVAKVSFYMKHKKMKLSKTQTFLGAVLSTVVALGSLISAYPFFFPEQEYGRLVNSLYHSLHRVSWSLAFGTMIVLQLNSSLGVLSTLISYKVFVPLSRLTLCVLVVHPLIQQFLFTKMRAPNYIDIFVLSWSGAGDIMVSYGVSVIMFLFIEAPLANLLDFLLRKAYSKIK